MATKTVELDAEVAERLRELAAAENRSETEIVRTALAAYASGATEQEEDSAKLEKRFHELAENWRLETGANSSVSRKLNHPAYAKMVALGPKAIPLILIELRDRPGLWFDALGRLSQATPVPPEHRHDPKLAREAWLRWGKEQGYLQ